MQMNDLSRPKNFIGMMHAVFQFHHVTQGNELKEERQ
jgi:hypothetical protein